MICLTYAVSFAYKHILPPSNNISQLAHDTQIKQYSYFCKVKRSYGLLYKSILAHDTHSTVL